MDRAEKAIQSFGADRVLLNPDCGFATFADNPITAATIAEKKLSRDRGGGCNAQAKTQGLVVSAHCLNDLWPREHDTRMLGEQAQKPILGRLEHDRKSVDKHFLTV